MADNTIMIAVGVNGRQAALKELEAVDAGEQKVTASAAGMAAASDTATQEMASATSDASQAVTQNLAQISTAYNSVELGGLGDKFRESIAAGLNEGEGKFHEFFAKAEDIAKRELIILGIAVAAGVTMGAVSAVYAAYKSIGFLKGLITGDSYKSEDIDALIAINKEVRELQGSLQLTAADATALRDALARLNVNKADISAVYEKTGAAIRDNADELDRLGVKYKGADGKILATSAVVANAKLVLDSYTEGWDRNQAEAALSMGSYEQITNYLKVNQEEVMRSKARLDEFNLGIGPESQAAVQRYQVAMLEFNNETKLMGDGFKRVWADSTMPILTNFSEYLKEGWPSAVNVFRYTAAQFATLLLGMDESAYIAAVSIKAALTSIVDVGEGATLALAKLATGDLAGAKEELAKGWHNASVTIDNAGKDIVAHSAKNAAAMKLAWAFDDRTLSKGALPGSGAEQKKAWVAKPAAEDETVTDNSKALNDRRATLDAALAIELATLKATLEKETEAYKTQDKELELVLAQRSISEAGFYQKKGALQQAALQSAISELEKEKAAILKESAAKAGLYKDDQQRIKEEGEVKAKAAAIDGEIDKRKQEAIRAGIDLRIKDIELQRQLSLAAVKIAESDYAAQVQWLDKLDAYKQKTGKISDETALAAKYDRERQTLALKQQTLEVEILQEQNDAKRLELEDQYWQIDEKIKQSKQDQLNETDLLIRKTEQLTFAHQQNMNAIAATAAVSALQFAGQDQAALTAQYAAQNAALQASYAEQIRLAGENHDLQLQAENQFQERKFQLQTEYSQKQADLWWNGGQAYLNFAQQMTTMGLQMMLFDEKNRDQIGKRMLATSIRFLASSLQQFMFSKAKEHLLAAASSAGLISTQIAQHTTSLALLETEAVAWAAFFAAMSLNPYGGQVFIPAATAMTAVAGVAVPAAMAATAVEGAAGIASELAMAAAWAAGGMLVGALGEAGASAIEGGTSGSTTAAGYGAGTPTSPVVTTSTSSTTQSTGPTYNVHIYGEGSYSDWDKVTREKIIPALNKANSDGY